MFWLENAHMHNKNELLRHSGVQPTFWRVNRYLSEVPKLWDVYDNGLDGGFGDGSTVWDDG